MTIHYHGTPITPNRVMLEMAGAHFCVSHAAPAQVKLCHDLGQSVMLDNGAFSVWKRGHEPDWNAYYDWSISGRTGKPRVLLSGTCTKAFTGSSG